MVKEAQRVGQQAHDRKAAKHDVEHGAADVARAAIRREQRDAGDADHDRAHREMLAPAGALAEHPLPDCHQHKQPSGKRGLHDDERGEFQRDHLERPAKDREEGAEQPAPASQQPRGEREPQVRVRGGLLRVECLKCDPYAVEDGGADRCEQPKDEIDHARR